MDDSLLAEFQGASVSGEVCDTSGPHPHYTLYKQKREGYGDQETRRRRFLEDQKTRRRNFVDYARKIVAGEVCEDMEDDDEVDDSGEAMQVSGLKGARKMKRYNPYRNQIMLSEWMVEVPTDLEENWLMVVCPIGQRCLVIASKATTTAYSRSGHCLRNFPSLLPGGCKRTHHTASDYCILDCIYHETNRTFFVLDLMCWRGHPVYDSDTEFRFYWLKTKLGEEGDALTTSSRTNPFLFLPLTTYPCTRDSMADVLGTSWPQQVDGLLFFHKEAHYTLCRSPLALWIKPHMVHDMLGVLVSKEFLDCAPVISSDSAKMDTGASRGTKGEGGGASKGRQAGDKGRKRTDDAKKQKLTPESTEAMESSANIT